MRRIKGWLPGGVLPLRMLGTVSNARQEQPATVRDVHASCCAADVPKKTICTLPLGQTEVTAFANAVRKHYWCVRDTCLESGLESASSGVANLCSARQ